MGFLPTLGSCLPWAQRLVGWEGVVQRAAKWELGGAGSDGPTIPSDGSVMAVYYCVCEALGIMLCLS